jgi:hypothetical protein
MVFMKELAKNQQFCGQLFALFMFLRIMNLVTCGNLVSIVTKTNSLIIFQTKKWVYT